MKILLSVAALLAMTVGSAIAQQKSTLQPGDVWFLLQAKAVQNDLGASDEVASKLNSLRVDSRAALEKEYQEAGINPRDFLECSPKVDPCVMRVQQPFAGRRILNERQEAQPGADHQEAA